MPRPLSAFGPFADIVAEYRAARIYRIIRFRQGSRPRTIRSNVTLAEAQAHCSKDSTHGPGWFDGYDYMPGVRPNA